MNLWIVPLEFAVTSTHFESGFNRKWSPLHFPPTLSAQKWTGGCLCFIPSSNAFLRLSSNTNTRLQLKCRERIRCAVGEKREKITAFTAECSQDIRPTKYQLFPNCNNVRSLSSFTRNRRVLLFCFFVLLASPKLNFVFPRSVWVNLYSHWVVTNWTSRQ